MDKIKKLINTAYEVGRLPKNLSLSDFRQLEDIYIELKKQGVSYTNSTYVALIFEENYPTNIKRTDIGWIIKN